jgi:hypothetical protein
MVKHLVIPDVQHKAGLSTDFLTHIGHYIVEHKPDVVIQIGDFADMPSLSSYDIGKKSFEGRRYKSDIEATHQAMSALLKPIAEFNLKQKKNKEKQYKPQMILTLGNHENRIERVVESDPKLEGTIGIEDLKYEDFGWHVVPYLQPIVLDGVAYCLGASHRVLCKDLKYRTLRDVEVGTEIVSFDEMSSGRGRRYKTGVITKKTIVPMRVYRVTLSNGKSFTATNDHRWLVRGRGGMQWKHTYELSLGTLIPKFFDEWDEISTKDAGWMAGILDGEGYLSKPNAKQGGLQVGFSQNEGCVADRAREIAKTLGQSLLEYKYRKCTNFKLAGDSANKLKFLGITRPERLISKFKPEMLGRMQSMTDYRIVSIEELPELEDIVQIKTTTETLIVDGYAHHNCHYFTSGLMGRPVVSARHLVQRKHQSCVMGHVQNWEMHREVRADGTPILGLFVGSCYEHNEDYLGPQGNNYSRGIWMLHEVSQGDFQPAYISLKYLRGKYGN